MYTQEKPDIHDYIEHHGILGMKWGIRRFQPYGKGSKSKGRFLGKKPKPKKGQKDKKDQNGSSKRDLRKASFQKMYEKKGLKKQEAADLAKRRVNMETAFKVALGVTVAAGTAYVVKKQLDLRMDKVIDMNTPLQRLTGNEANTLRNAFYATMDSKDNEKYKGLFGQHLQQRGKEVYVKKLNTKGQIKVASQENARKIMEKMIQSNPKVAETILSDLNIKFNGKLNAETYEQINRALPIASARSFATEYYNELKKQGYGAIQDINDMKYSGFRAKNPLIVFDSDKVDIKESIHLGKEKIQSYYDRESAKATKEEAIVDAGKALAAYTLLGGSTIAITKFPTNHSVKVVADYRKEHPNTELTYDQIITKYTNGEL